VNDVFEEIQSDYELRSKSDFENEFGDRSVFYYKPKNKIVSFSTIRMFQDHPFLGLLEFTCTAKMLRRKGHADKVMVKMLEFATLVGIALYSIVERINYRRQQMLVKHKFQRISKIPRILITEDLIDPTDIVFKWDSPVSL